jgi:hypothetical protein
MRAIFGIIPLLLVLVIVGSLVKKQLSVKTAPLQNLPTPASEPAASNEAPPTVREQSQQIQQQVKQAVEAQMQARPMPDDSK